MSRNLCPFVSPPPYNFRRETGSGRSRQSCPRWTCRKGRRQKEKFATSEGRGRAAKRSAVYDAMRIYRQHFQHLLEEELRAEQHMVLEKRKFGKQHNAGRFTMRGLLATKKKRLFSLSVYRLAQRAGNSVFPQANEFSKGDLVRLGPEGSDEDSFLEANVLAKYPGYLLVTVPVGSDGAAQMDSFVDHQVPVVAECGTNSVANERALKALESFTTEGPGTTDIAKLIVMSHLDSECNSAKSTNGIEELLKEDLLFMEDQPLDSHQDCNDSDGHNSVQGKWRGFCKETVSRIPPQVVSVAMRDLPGSLNQSQIAAIKTSMRRRLSLIQGPPGTGKTVTAAHMISCVLKLGLGPILACAASNVAADNLMQKIISVSGAGLRVVRIGRVPAIDEGLWDKTLESYLERDPAVREARTKCASGQMKFADVLGIEKGVARQVLLRAHVVVGTCVACGRDELEGLNFRYIIMDEATQASEPDVLIPLSISVRSKEQVQVALVGDQNQLPPTVLSRNSQPAGTTGLGTSLFMRLWRQGVETHLLNVQYRMHPQISSFPSKHFYFGRLRDGVSPVERPTPRFMSFGQSTNNSKRSSVIFVHVSDGSEEKDMQIVDVNGITGVGHSYRNKAEADVVVKLLGALVSTKSNSSIESAQSFSLADIGIISPYAGQVRFLKQIVAQLWGASTLEVSTIDGFQGREKDVILLSSVRSNETGEVGFLNDWRRLNVAITRARLLLVVIGNEKTLSSDPHWRAWLKWVKRYGATTSVSVLDPKRGKAKP